MPSKREESIMFSNELLLYIPLKENSGIGERYYIDKDIPINKFMSWVFIGWEYKYYIGDGWRDEIATNIYEYVLSNVDLDNAKHSRLCKQLRITTEENIAHLFVDIILSSIDKVMAKINQHVSGYLKDYIDDDIGGYRINKVQSNYGGCIIHMVGF